jgi:F0F1-ATPase subunit, putative
MIRPDDNGNRAAPMAEPVRRTRERRERREREGERPVGRNLALIGALGWLVVTPTLLGLLAGRWFDRLAGGGIFWTASLIFAGVALGGWLAWKRIVQEH